MKKSNKILMLSLIVFVVVGLSYSIYKDYRNEHLMHNSQTTKAILIKEYHNSLRFLNGEFYFFVQKKRYEVTIFQDFSHLTKGDTVLIEYSVEDPSVARVIDKYYMQKYRHLKHE